MSKPRRVQTAASVKRFAPIPAEETYKVKREVRKAPPPSLGRNPLWNRRLRPRKPLYEPIDGPHRRIRLLRLESSEDEMVSFSLCIVNLDDEPRPEYIALSYAWGPAQDNRSIQLNDQVVQIRRNLFDFLVHFASKDRLRDQPIWIDQLCINQASVKEKNDQVSMMGDIYRLAKTTLIWLGEDEDDGLAFATIEEECSGEIAEIASSGFRVTE